MSWKKELMYMFIVLGLTGLIVLAHLATKEDPSRGQSTKQVKTSYPTVNIMERQ